MELDIKEVIRERGLKITPVRLQVLRILSRQHLAFSHADLEADLEDVDRITLYRVLNDFEEVGLVHKVVDMEGVARFAFCTSECGHGHHADNHVHFNCQNCHKMFCMEKIETPSVKVPRGFKVAGLNTIVYGICKDCSSQN
jgi:Fur family transcriptional regulator, ferric uptake regulator